MDRLVPVVGLAAVVELGAVVGLDAGEGCVAVEGLLGLVVAGPADRPEAPQPAAISEAAASTPPSAPCAGPSSGPAHPDRAPPAPGRCLPVLAPAPVLARPPVLLLGSGPRPSFSCGGGGWAAPAGRAFAGAP